MTLETLHYQTGFANDFATEAIPAAAQPTDFIDGLVAMAGNAACGIHVYAANRFRPPWFHRNFASEFMGPIHGANDAKAEGFTPGGASLHNCMTWHGPDADTFAKASAADTTRPDPITDTMAFMFETPALIQPTRHALETAQLQHEYFRCWQGLKKHCDPIRRSSGPASTWTASSNSAS